MAEGVTRTEDVDDVSAVGDLYAASADNEKSLQRVGFGLDDRCSSREVLDFDSGGQPVYIFLVESVVGVVGSQKVGDVLYGLPSCRVGCRVVIDAAMPAPAVLR